MPAVGICRKTAAKDPDRTIDDRIRHYEKLNRPEYDTGTTGSADNWNWRLSCRHYYPYPELGNITRSALTRTNNQQ